MESDRANFLSAEMLDRLRRIAGQWQILSDTRGMVSGTILALLDCHAAELSRRTGETIDREEFVCERLIAWVQNPQRKPAELAFTSGPLRDVAYAVKVMMRTEASDPTVREKDFDHAMGCIGMLVEGQQWNGTTRSMAEFLWRRYKGEAAEETLPPATTRDFAEVIKRQLAADPKLAEEVWREVGRSEAEAKRVVPAEVVAAAMEIHDLRERDRAGERFTYNADQVLGLAIIMSRHVLAARGEKATDPDAIYRMGESPVDQVRHIPLAEFVATRFVTVGEHNERMAALDKRWQMAVGQSLETAERLAESPNDPGTGSRA